MKYELGQKVWYAGVQNIEKQMPCDTCFGKRFITVILGDDSQVTLMCEGCKGRGGEYSYEEYSRGYNIIWQYESFVREASINRIEAQIKDGVPLTEYGIEESWRVDESQLFLSKEDAEVEATRLAKEMSDKAEESYKQKHQDKKSWAWNVNYYKRQIKEAQETVERATKKLAYAEQRKKD